MATIDALETKPSIDRGFGPASPQQDSLIATSPLVMCGKMLASLRLTVGLLCALLFLVLAGTAAQVEHGIWYVVDEAYFRVWFAKIEFQAFTDLYNAFRATENNIEFYSDAFFWFPGGYLIGLVMVANLLAAHSLRFKVTASGSRLLAGIATTTAGVLALTWVAFNWLDETQVGQLSQSATFWLWFGLKASVVAAAAAGAMWLVIKFDDLRRTDWALLAGVNALLMFVAGGLSFGNWSIPPEAMRIVWMLAQGTLAGAVVLTGCWLVFDRRAGVVLLHAGILVLMGHEFYTGMAAQESHMRIDEGQAANYSVDERHAELVLVDRSHPDHDTHFVIHDDRLRQAAESGNVISDAGLPVDVRVVEYFRHSTLKSSKDDSLATVGVGKAIAAVPAESRSTLAGGGLDLPSAYVELLDKTSGKSLGTYLVSTRFDESVALGESRLRELGSQPVVAGERKLDLGLRLLRHYRPFQMTLIDFRFDRYPGTSKARNFSSELRINDPEHATRTVTISMNNPLRYRGETYYQQSYDEATEQTTILQVVKNEGYMLPYLSCMLVLLGMVWHFGAMLTRFLTRRASQAAQLADDEETTPGEVAALLRFIFPLVAAIGTAACFAYAMQPATDQDGQMQLEAFGKLPVLDSGRVKPFDTLARNTLQYLSARQEAPTRVPTSESDDQVRISATQWLLDVVSGKPEADDYPVFRIDNLEVLKELGLEPRQKFYRYSINEIEANFEPILAATDEAMKRDKRGEKLSTFELKAIEVAEKRAAFSKLANAFFEPRFLDPVRQTEAELRSAVIHDQRLREWGAPRCVPPSEVGDQWQTLFGASLAQRFRVELGLPDNPVEPAMRELLTAYRNGSADEFNSAVQTIQQHAEAYERQLFAPANAEHLASLKATEQLRTHMLSREKWLNDSALFYVSAVAYLFAFLLASLSWLGGRQLLGRAALSIICVTFLVHTFAIWQRVEISGRPPITNLYDTTICVGWACVLLGIVFDVMYRLGIGSFVAAAVGYCTLIIGHYLSQDGDTFTVLQAVLDTNFWLTVHVITINLGYATSVLAGCLGIAWVLLCQVFSALEKKEEQQLSRMIYGTVCFAILFSFVGTVLGGLWADDSWGRFWGWDPKENGALMVVLWNAVILHARWGGMARQRGVALLAIFGNVITAWSWFGTNGLGIGLHAYGFTEGTAQMLLVFWLCNLAVIGLGLIDWDKLLGRDLRQA